MIKNLFLATLFSLLTNFVLAACPSAYDLNKNDICVTNNLDKTLLYSQFPNDFGTIDISAHETATHSEADRDAVESIDLYYPNNGGSFQHFKLATCGGKIFFNEDGTKVLVEVVRGCH